MTPISRFSEPVSPSGGLQAQGLLNLLGAPPMDPLTIVLREAAQNIWDARLEGTSPRMLVRIRTLTEQQSDVLRGILSTGFEESGEPPRLDLTASQLGGKTGIPVLEICDFGTHGLNGSTNPVLESSRFVKFFFDIGAPHFDGKTGGTYGFGRSSLYLVGKARTILVDSLPVDGRRLMACRLGESYTAGAGANAGKRHTGRHFWGARNEGHAGVAPMVGEAASNLSRQLGMPERSDTETGTSILIPWPEIDSATARHLIPKILYHNLWPKLVANGAKVPMTIEVDAGEGARPLSIELAHPVYQAFAWALGVARTRNSPAKAIGPERPRIVAGHVAVAPARGLSFDEPLADQPDPHRTFREGVRHVALMRANELVVRYQRVELDTPAAPWVGIMLADAAPEVAAAFAASEPPAHDDWIVGKLGGTAATIVRTTLRKLQPAIQELLGVRATTPDAGTEGISLADAADHFADAFIAGEGTAASRQQGRPGGGSARSPAGVSIPEFAGFALDGERTIARYTVRWGGGAGSVLRANAEVAIDGGSSDEGLAGLVPPHVVGWTLPTGETASGAECRTTGPGTYGVALAYGGTYAMSLTVTPEEGV